jgi:hypothetical protein
MRPSIVGTTMAWVIFSAAAMSTQAAGVKVGR